MKGREHLAQMVEVNQPPVQPSRFSNELGVIVEERMEGMGDRKAGAFSHLFSHSFCSFWLRKIHFLLILTERSSEGGRAPNASQERRRK